jgi:hypothetical protein
MKKRPGQPSEETSIVILPFETYTQLFKDTWIEIVPLPTYSPKLNVIELLWKYLRRKVTHNHLYASIEKLVDAALEFLKSLNEKPAEVLSVIGCSE